MDKDLLLIDAVKARQCLYDRREPDFKVEQKKTEAWEEIARSLDRPVKECQRRWRTIRERFVRDMKIAATGGGSANIVELVPWELTSKLEFLKEFVKHRRTGRAKTVGEGHSLVSYEVGGDLLEEDSLLEDQGEAGLLEYTGEEGLLTTAATSSNRAHEAPVFIESASALPVGCNGVTQVPESSVSGPAEKRLKISISDDVLRELQLHRDRRATSPHLQPDEDELFGQTIVASLKKLPGQQKALAKVKIQQVLYEVQYCQLT